MTQQRTTAPCKRVEISLGYACNNHCVFCSEQTSRADPRARAGATLDLPRLMDAITRFWQEGARHLTFLGGEPTVHRDLPTLMEHASGLGFNLAMTTNGRRLADPALVRALAMIPRLRITVSLHGHRAQVHDRVCGEAGAFDQVMHGLDNLKVFGMGFDLTAVVCAANLPHLSDLYRFHQGLTPGRRYYAYVRPIGGAYERFEEVVPRFGDAAPHLSALLAQAAMDRAPLTLGHVPLCFFGPHPGFCDELYWDDDPDLPLREVNKFAAINHQTVTGLPFVVTFDHYKVKPLSCAGCRYAGVCAGVFREYGLKRGYEELTPVAGEPVLRFADLRLPHLARKD